MIDAGSSPNDVPRVAPQIVHDTAPALGWYSDHILFHRIWNRTALSRRDRSVVTVSALIACNHYAQLTGHLNRALDHGVTPDELPELVTHLAFTCGWPNAMSAMKVLREVLSSRGISAERPEQPTGSPIDLSRTCELADAGSIAALLEAELGQIVEDDLGVRPILAPRDRALANLTVMIATGDMAALSLALDRALQYGLSSKELAEVVLHLGYYTGIAKARQAATIIDSRIGALS